MRLSLRLVLFAWVAAIGLRGQTVTGTIATGTPPEGIGANSVTNTIYVTNGIDNTVTVIDGTANTTATVPVGKLPWYVVANPVTNKAYVENLGDDSITVIDGATLATTSIQVAGLSGNLAINSMTNKVYALICTGSCSGIPTSPGELIVIDGATNAITATLPVGDDPRNLAVNEVTNKIYVLNCGLLCNSGEGSVTVIDGATNAEVTVPAGIAPLGVAVNPVTNKIYVANIVGGNSPGTVTVIDGATNVTTTIAVAWGPESIAVNSLTNKIYVPSFGNPNSTLTIIDGASNTTSTLNIGKESIPLGIAVNQATNQIYVTQCNVQEGGQMVDAVSAIDGSTLNIKSFGAGSSECVIANPVIDSATNKTFVLEQANDAVLVIDGATNVPTKGAEGSSPFAIAVDAVSNKAYVANRAADNLTVVEGTAFGSSTVETGSGPSAVAVNPLTAKIYVANHGSDNVTEIDEATNATSTIGAGDGPIDVAVNPLTNMIYVANYYDKSVTVIDAASNATTSVRVGTFPDAATVNPVTNMIYVANYGSDSVSVISGATNGVTATVSVGTNPRAIAVNPNTNQVYVANWGSNNVTVIDGATNATTTIAVGTNPTAVAVNPVTGRIYIANFGSGSVTVIDGVTNSTRVIPASYAPCGLAVNVASNKIYVANGDGQLRVIDGATSTISTVVEDSSFAVGVNPSTGEVYAATHAGWLTLVNPNNVSAIPLAVSLEGKTDAETVPGFAMFTTADSSPLFAASATSTFTPTVPPPTALYYQLDTTQGTWQVATRTTSTGSNPAGYQLRLHSVPLGIHTLYAYSTYDNGASLSGSTGDSVALSNVVAYPFAVLPPTPAAMISPMPGSTLGGTSATFTWTPGAQVKQYLLYVGTQYRSDDLDLIYPGTTTTATVTNLPTNGSGVYVTLFSFINGGWEAVNYFYVASGTASKALITSPTGSTITGASAVFDWSAGSGVSRYCLRVGTTEGGYDLDDVCPSGLTATITNLPANGSTVWVRLRSLIDGAWQYEDVSYTNAP